MLEMEDDRAGEARERSRTLKMLEMEDDGAGDARERLRTVEMLEMEGDGAGDARELSRTLKMLEMEDGSRHQNMVLSTKSIMSCLCSNCSRFDMTIN